MEHLVAAGYRILDRNYRTRYGEIDIVAADERHLVFCEVKARVAGGSRGPAGPLGAVGPAKRRRLRLLAVVWLSDEAAGASRPSRPALRFDAIGVTVDRSGRVLALEHVEAAF